MKLPLTKLIIFSAYACSPLPLCSQEKAGADTSPGSILAQFEQEKAAIDYFAAIKITFIYRDKVWLLEQMMADARTPSKFEIYAADFRDAREELKKAETREQECAAIFAKANPTASTAHLPQSFKDHRENLHKLRFQYLLAQSETNKVLYQAERDLSYDEFTGAVARRPVNLPKPPPPAEPTIQRGSLALPPGMTKGTK